MALRLTPGGVVVRYALLATVWIVFSGYLLAVAVEDPTLLATLEAGKGLLFVAVTSGLLFVLLRAWARDEKPAPATPGEPRLGNLPLGTYRLAILLLTIALIVPLISVVIARHLAPGFEREAHAHLASIARLQAGQARNWFSEHRIDARLIAEDRRLVDWVANLAPEGEREPLPADIRDRLRLLQWSCGYDGIEVLDSKGTSLLTLGRPDPVTESDLRLIAAEHPLDRVHRTDLHPTPAGSIVVRLTAVLQQDALSEPAGYVTLTLNPETAILPMALPWPVADSTGRMRLVRQTDPLAVEIASVEAEDGTQRVRVFPSFVPNASLAASLRDGAPGVLGDTDRAGVPILAAHHPIYASDWQIVASLERSEVLTPLWETIFWINLVAFLAALLVSAAILQLWRTENRNRDLSERSRALALLGSHISNSPLAAVEMDPDFRVRRWSPRATEMFGWSADEAEGRNLFEWGLVHPDDSEAVRSAIQGLMDGTTSRGQGWNRNLTKDGEVRYCEWYNSVLRDSRGRVESIFSLAQDITERVRMEQALAESEAQLRSLIEGAPDAIFVQTNRRFAFVNAATCRLFGAKSPEELIGTPVLERVQADYRPAIEENIRAVNERGESRKLVEEVYLRLDETEVPVEVAAQPVLFDGQNGALVFARDISARKAYQRQLDKNSRLLQMASTVAHIGGWEVDLKSDRVAWSDEVCRIHDVPLGTTVAVADGIGYYAPEWRNRITERFTACTRDGTPYDEELEILTASGKRVWVRTVGQPVRDDTGDIVRIEGAFQDISDEHAIRGQLEQANARLYEREQQLELFIEHAPVGLAIFDRDMRYLATSRRWRDTYGRGHLETPGASHYAVFPELDEPRKEAHRRGLAGEVVRKDADLLERSDGVSQWIRWEVRPWLTADGNIGGIMVLGEDVTEQRNALERIRDSEAKLRAITETSPDPIIMADEHGTLVYCNHAVETTLGYSREELIGKDLHQTLAPERYQATVLKGYESFARSGKGRVIGTVQELVALHRDGHEVPVEISVSSLQIDGRWHAVGILRDITARRQFEDRLSLEARRAQALLELPRAAEKMDEAEFMQRGQEIAEDLTASRIAFIHFVHEDQDTIELVTWSRRTLEDYCEVPDLEPHYPVAAAGIWADGLRERRPIVVNDYAAHPGRHGLPEGHAELLRLISVPVIENGKVTMLAGVGNKDQDYTETDVETVQLIAEQIWAIVQRRRSERRLKQLSLGVEQSPDSIVITNLAGEIEYVNEAFLKTTGYTWSEVIGQNPRILQSGHTPKENYLAMWDALTRGDTWKGEFYNRRKDGTEYVEFGHVAPLRQANGEITNYVAVKEDITEKKLLGEELDRHRHHLEELVTQRTAELAEAQQQAESANRTKSAFLANMSHEIRTPMNGVLGMVELLWNTELTDEQAEMLETIRESGKSLTGIIDDILDFSKIEAGRVEIEHVPICVRDVVEGLCISLAPLAGHREVDLSCFVAPEIPERVLGDEVRLRQVLYNLVGNGIKFSSALGTGRRGRVCVRVERSADDPTRILFMISDNGIGMSEENQARLFQPFAQAEASTTRKFGGTGLGLTISKKLADLMSGDITVSSAPDAGSMFTVTLPLVAPPDQPAAPNPDLHGVHCVLVDTSAFYRDVRGTECGVRDIARHLEYAGASVDIFSDEDAARRRAFELTAPVIMLYLGGHAESAAAHDPAESTPLPEIRIQWGVKNTFRASGTSLLDAAALTRANLMRAVATALGRGDSSMMSGEQEPPAHPFAPTTGPRASETARILVVEDDVINRKVIQKQLEVLGYHADVTVNGVEALQRWRDQPYDLVLTDLHMPEMDGYELTRHIREEESAAPEAGTGRPRTPIIALTANALRGEAEKGKAMGLDDYLTKPLELEALDAALQQHLPHAAGQAPVSDPHAAAAPAPTASAPPLFDVTVLKDVVGDDRETHEMLLREYLNALDRTWDAIEGAVREADTAAIGAAAHNLKSSSRSVGATRLGELAAQLESAGKAHDTEAIPPLVHEASGIRAELEAAIQAFLQPGGDH